MEMLKVDNWKNENHQRFTSTLLVWAPPEYDYESRERKLTRNELIEL